MPMKPFDPVPPQKPAASPVPTKKGLPTPLVHGFIKAVRPAGEGPADEMIRQHREVRRRDLGGFIVPGTPRDSGEYFVELRIREWMMRKEREDAEMRRQEAARRETAHKNPPPKNTPPRI